VSYDIYVDNANKGQVASNGGWHETARYMEKHGGEHAKVLATTGECENAHALSQDIHAIRKQATPDVESVLKHIARYDSKHSHIGISQEEITHADHE
jgi:hypothetical protein